MDAQEPNSPWTPYNKFLTPSNKMDRRAICDYLGTQLESLKQKGNRDHLASNEATAATKKNK